jgi:hypothetical protein
VVFTGTNCERMTTYEAATGKPTHTHVFVDKVYRIRGRSVPLEAHVEGTEWGNGQLWYLTWSGELGYIEDGAPVPVLDAADFGLTETPNDSPFMSALTGVPEDGLLLAGILHADPDKLDPGPWEWIGVSVGEDDDGRPTATVQPWRLWETGRGLGLPDLRRSGSVALRDEQTGGLMLASLTGGRVALDQPDPETGELVDPAVNGSDETLSVLDDGLASGPQYVVHDRMLYTASDRQSERYYRRWVSGYDLAAGTRRWRTKLPTPHTDPDGLIDEYQVESVQVGDDGTVYAITTTGDYVPSAAQSVLHRLDPETGAITDSWRLPKDLADGGYDVHVVGDEVVAVANGEHNSTNPKELGGMILGVPNE